MTLKIISASNFKEFANYYEKNRINNLSKAEFNQNIDPKSEKM